jgi:hypothetical protein
MTDQIGNWPRLAQNREFSQRQLTDIRAEAAHASLDGILTVAMAGSFGRDEASEVSDADFIIVLQDDATLDEERRHALNTNVYAAVAGMFTSRGIVEPNPNGVFAEARTLSELLPADLDGGIGQPSEHSDVMGKRLLLLLESKWLWNEEGYHRTIEAIFDRYAKHVREEPRKEFVLLLNDLIRYFRYICVNYESTFDLQRDKWAIRNVKLRHSRLLMYFGLLVLLGEASSMGPEAEKHAWVRDQLALTPLERVQLAYNRANDSKFSLVAGLYNSFLESISDPSLREMLSAVAYSDRYQNQEFARLKANSDAFQGELARFCYGQRGRWSDRFYEYLIF